MSTGCECSFIEVEPNKWYYILEDYNAPKNAWDWREYAEAFGPFPTEDAAFAHLRDNHANPGGSSSQHYDPANPYQPDDVMTRLMAEAEKRAAEERAAPRFPRFYPGIGRFR
jgi:hypothetical protein